jgi:hypothetical protein
VTVLGELPEEVREVFARFITCEYVTVDVKGQAIAWPVTPYMGTDGSTLDITTGVGYPKKADDAARHPHVAQLFSDPTGCGLDGPPVVLAQSSATIHDSDFPANRERYRRESLEKLPATKELYPPKFIEPILGWYFDRIYVKMAPERVLVWPDGDCTKEPTVYGVPLEALAGDSPPAGDSSHAGDSPPVWDERMDELGSRYDSAVLAWENPDDYPIAVRLPVSIDRNARRIVFPQAPAGVQVRLGKACVTAHSHSPEFLWQENFQVRGELTRDGDGLVLVPQKLIGGFELPKESRIAGVRRNFSKARRYAKIARRRRAQAAS